MAGLIVKSFGALFLVPGLVLIVAGLVAAVAGWSEFNQVFADSPSEEDEERAKANAYIAMGGLVAIGLGIIATTIGSILIVIGRGRERKALANPAPQPTPATAPTKAARSTPSTK